MSIMKRKIDINTKTFIQYITILLQRGLSAVLSVDREDISWR